ncbi:alpha,alpha-trehalose-phosphate synthase [Flagelloscypha sp. PMI_526]|nr:alpha,alpha-trehalose-phosphate synthase [Flagelloscypha sp. PMI_526]
MNALQSRRILIATLFLPDTPIFHDDLPSDAERVPTSDGMMSKAQPPPLPMPPKRSLTPLTPAGALSSGLGSAESLLPTKEGLMVRPGVNTSEPKLKAATSIVDDLQEKRSRMATPVVSQAPVQTSPRLAAVSEALDKQSPFPTRPNLGMLREESDDLSKVDKITFVHNSHGNGGLRNAVNSVGDRLRRKLWIGTPNTSHASYGCDKAKRAEIELRYRSEKNSVPVWVPDHEFSAMYDEFCHQVLWPCLHYAIPDAPKGQALYKSEAYKDYVSVNQKFADIIVDEWKPGDIIWVNDYHLLLLPLLLRTHHGWQTKHQKNPLDVPIGFFLHVAFPSSEIFRCLSTRKQLLRGVLASDLVGFQTANNARHFRQTVSRILTWEALPKGIQIPDEESEGISRGRFVDVGVFPIGIDVWGLREKKQNPEVAYWVQALSQRYTGMKLIVGRDKLDAIQGVRQKIQAFESFLDHYPEFQGNVILIQVALQTTESNELQGGVAEAVASINAKYSTLTYQPVVFLHTADITFSQYVGLLTVADSFMVTSLREGMALRTHEFVECQEDRHRPLILSEFTGSYSYSGFRSCIPINPWDTRGTGDAIYHALTMSDQEAKQRWEELHNQVIAQTAQNFVTTFLTRVVRSHAEHVQLCPGSDRRVPNEFGLDLWQRDTTMPGLLTFEKEVEEGTFSPPEHVIQLTSGLMKDPRNEVWLLSGLQVEGVMEKFAQLLGPNVGIVAENGCFIKPKGESEWISRVSNASFDWKDSCLEILHYNVVHRLFGGIGLSPIRMHQPRPPSPCEDAEEWHRQHPDLVDRQWARRQAAEAQNHIFDSLGERYHLRIVPGSNSFLVIPNFASRSSVMAAILTPGMSLHGLPQSPRSSLLPPAGSSYMTSSALDGPDSGGELVVCISKEERLLRRVNEFGETSGRGDSVFTVSTRITQALNSNKGTDAKWYLDMAKVPSILDELVQVDV